VIGALLDHAVMRSQQLRGAHDARIDAMTADDRLEKLEALRAIYDRDELLPYGAFLHAGAPITPTRIPVRRGVVDLAWAGDYEPWLADVRELYGTHASNATVHARMFQSERPGPTVVVIHGYGAGHLAFEQLIWPVRDWRKRGFDVVLATLPFHGRRAPAGRALAPPFPASDPRITIEGFRQAVAELTALIAWLRAQGHGPIGVLGMSLGGYTAGLLATLADDLAFAGMVIPLASMGDYALDHGKLGTGPDAVAQHAVIEGVFRLVSPLSRPSRLPPERVKIVAARQDRITGMTHANKLAAHFGVEPVVCPGSHILQRLSPGWAALGPWMTELAGTGTPPRA
jgi:hypothetical protein